MMKFIKLQFKPSFDSIHCYDREKAKNHISPCGQLMLKVAEDRLGVYDIETDNLLLIILEQAKDLTYYRFSWDGKLILTINSLANARLWRASTGELIGSLDHFDFPTPVSTVACSKDVNICLNIGIGKSWIWDVRNGATTIHLGEEMYVPGISSDFSFFLKREKPDEVKVIDAATLKEIASWKREKNHYLVEMIVSPDDQLIALGYREIGTNYFIVKILRKETWELIQTIRLHSRNPESGLDLTLGHKSILMSAYVLSKSTLWEIESGKKILTSIKDKDIQAINPDGHHVVANSNIGLALWDTRTGKKKLDYLPPAGEESSKYTERTKFSASGNKMVCRYSGGKIRIWDTYSGKLICLIKDYFPNFTHFQMSPDEKHLLTYSSRNYALVWDAETGQKMFWLNGDISPFQTVSYSQDGRFIFSGGFDSSYIDIDWEVDFSKTVMVHQMKDADFSSRVWDAQNGKLLFYRIQFSEQHWIAFDPEGRYDGSEQAADLLYFLCPLDLLEEKSVQEMLHVPGLVEKVLAGDTLDTYPKLQEL